MHIFEKTEISSSPQHQKQLSPHVSNVLLTITQILNSQTSQFSSPYLPSPPFSKIDPSTGASAVRLAAAALSPFRQPSDGQVQRGDTTLPCVPAKIRFLTGSMSRSFSRTAQSDQSITRVVEPWLNSGRRRVVS